MTDATDELAHAQYSLATCQRLTHRLEKRAGDAAWNWDVVKDRLEEQCQAFEVQWREASLENLRKAGGRISREAGKLIAAQKLPAAQQATREASARVKDLRERVA